jgi:hypothetical protein
MVRSLFNAAEHEHANARKRQTSSVRTQDLVLRNRTPRKADRTLASPISEFRKKVRSIPKSVGVYSHYPSVSGAVAVQFQPDISLGAVAHGGNPLSYRRSVLDPASALGPILSSFKESRSFDLQLAPAKLDNLLEVIEEQVASEGQPSEDLVARFPTVLRCARREGGPDRPLSSHDGGPGNSSAGTKRHGWASAPVPRPAR